MSMPSCPTPFFCFHRTAEIGARISACFSQCRHDFTLTLLGHDPHLVLLTPTGDPYQCLLYRKNDDIEAILMRLLLLWERISHLRIRIIATDLVWARIYSLEVSGL